MDDAADDSFEEISFFSFIFVLEVYIYRERDISLTKIWRKFRNELLLLYPFIIHSGINRILISLDGII